MRRLAYVFGGLAAAGAGTYLVIYLYRWQWQRAMICGVLLLVVEVMLFGLVVLARLSRIEERLRDSDRRQRETAARQDDALARLPLKHRTAVVLRYYVGLSEAEIAAHLGCPVGSVGPWLRRGLDRLAAELRLPPEAP